MASNPLPGSASSGAPGLDSRKVCELPGAFDEEFGVIFREMRDASGRTKPDLARKLNTSVRTLDALEKGALLALPAWPETSRVILAYAGMLGLDGQPILRRINGQFASRGMRPARGGVGAVPDFAASGLDPDAQQLDYSRFAAGHRADHPTSRRGRRTGIMRGGPLRWLFAFVMVAIVAAGVLYAAQRPALVLSLADGMPDLIAGITRAALQGDASDTGSDYADPRSRKADRLPVRGEDRPALR